MAGEAFTASFLWLYIYLFICIYIYIFNFHPASLELSLLAAQHSCYSLSLYSYFFLLHAQSTFKLLNIFVFSI